MKQVYCRIWEYRVRADHLAEFEAGYGADGDWAELFRRASGYLRTELFRDHDDLTRFLTIDYWESRGSYESFRSRFNADYEALDSRFEDLTTSENLVGCFSR